MTGTPQFCGRFALLECLVYISLIKIQLESDTCIVLYLVGINCLMSFWMNRIPAVGTNIL